jgi:uncharacterized protein with HEPN domain
VSDFRLHDYLDHIHQAASDARSFIEGLGKNEFVADKRTQNAVVMSLIVIGEAAGKVMDRYPDFAARHTEIPWPLMRGMRNRIAHGYFDIDFDVVWDTVNTVLPALLARLAAIRTGEDSKEGNSGGSTP